ncbi:hypothetical protein LOTGIDRAFT_153235 [Lottia gigantea]|uniref:Myosin tail domain-containing protein n=1 Tax=Lottia gigantea TaxID=225164 RepID=V4AF36_LOTGI|nr:hypothetical protein LOTGIDRAFT_153235 [Lottia gigantea]ESO93770.1 hypothetical protein LOTGIDRAFT_153235 [Lottia gigantea]
MRRTREAVATQRKVERIYKEYIVQTEDDRRQLAELSSINDTLANKVRQYKRQMDEAEDIANLTMNKYRKANALVEEAEHRADLAEKNLTTVRRARSMSVTREVVYSI